MADVIDLWPMSTGGGIVYAASPGLPVEARAFWVGVLIFLALVAALPGKEDRP